MRFVSLKQGFKSEVLDSVFDIDHFIEIESVRLTREKNYSNRDSRGRWWGHLPPNSYIKSFLGSVEELIYPENVLEIGTCLAYSSSYILQSFFGCRLTSVDIRKQSISGIIGIDLVLNKYPDRFTFVENDSKNLLSLFQENTFDVCLIDGDHSYDMAMLDIENCKKLKIPHLIVDNLSHPDVAKAVKDSNLELILEGPYVNLKKIHADDDYEYHYDSLNLYRYE